MLSFQNCVISIFHVLANKNRIERLCRIFRKEIRSLDYRLNYCLVRLFASEMQTIRIVIVRMLKHEQQIVVFYEILLLFGKSPILKNSVPLLRFLDFDQPNLFLYLQHRQLEIFILFAVLVSRFLVGVI